MPIPLKSRSQVTSGTLAGTLSLSPTAVTSERSGGMLQKSFSLNPF